MMETADIARWFGVVLPALAASCVEFPAPLPIAITEDIEATCPLDCPDPCLDVSGMSAGALGTCALVAGHPVCWGERGHGQLLRPGIGPTAPDCLFGRPSEVDEAPPVIEATAAGALHTCGLAADGQVLCWGDNSYGQVIGSGLATVAHSIPDLADVAAIAAGDYTSCAVTDGGVWCWGLELVGELPDPDLFTPGLPVTGKPEPISGLPAGVDRIAIGTGHACVARTGTATVHCWGANASGQIGVAAPAASSQPQPSQPFGTSGRIVAIDARGDTTCALEQGSAVACWGNNGSGQLGVNPKAIPASSLASQIAGTPQDVRSLAVGSGHVCLATDREVWCWGANDQGQLGFAGAVTSWAPQPVVGLDDSGIVALAAGERHTCAATSEAVYCWGANDASQLGDGTYGEPRSSPSAVTGLVGGR